MYARAAMAPGLHVLADFNDCDRAALDDEPRVKQAMLEAARLAGATVITDFIHRFSPHGLSGVVVIAESHLTIHTWPELGYAAVDLFTCGTTLRPEAALDHLARVLGARHHTVSTAQRGPRASDPAR